MTTKLWNISTYIHKHPRHQQDGSYVLVNTRAQNGRLNCSHDTTGLCTRKERHTDNLGLFHNRWQSLLQNNHDSKNEQRENKVGDRGSLNSFEWGCSSVNQSLETYSRPSFVKFFEVSTKKDFTTFIICSVCISLFWNRRLLNVLSENLESHWIFFPTPHR